MATVSTKKTSRSMVVDLRGFDLNAAAGSRFDLPWPGEGITPTRATIVATRTGGTWNTAIVSVLAGFAGADSRVPLAVREPAVRLGASAASVLEPGDTVSLAGDAAIPDIALLGASSLSVRLDTPEGASGVADLRVELEW